jgi:transposase
MVRPSRLVYVDESGIDEFLYREYARAPRGCQITTDIPGKKFARCSIVAAKCGDKIIAPFGYTGTCNSKLFVFWLKTILIPLLKKGQIVIMDNASIHKSKEIRELIEKAGCHLVFLPAYSPDLNPIEHSWSHVKQKIRSSTQAFASLFDAMQWAVSECNRRKTFLELHKEENPLLKSTLCHIV